MTDLKDVVIKTISKCDSSNLVNISRRGIIEFYKEIRELLFYDYYHSSINEEKINNLIESARNNFSKFLKYFEKKLSFEDFFENYETLRELLYKDVVAIYDGDPACNSYIEVVLAYPGFIAISAYRIAHILYNMGLKFVARVISEYAHSRTGVDINPGAKIGEYFFIDHGTGIVIGETCEIGSHVKIYQGVTLGALSLKEGHALQGQKRHPTIKDNVTIYSGASIFGGNTIIGENSIIGSNAYITSSVPSNSLVKVKPYDIEIIQKK